MAVLLEPSAELPEQVNEVFVKARSCWLKNPEVADLLENYSAYGIPVSAKPPVQPAGGVTCQLLCAVTTDWPSRASAAAAVLRPGA